MASWFTHVFVAGALGKAQPSHIHTTRFWMLSIFCSIVPDADVLGYAMGIEYGHMFGHCGFMHSLLFALGLALLAVMWGFPGILRGSKIWWLMVIHFFLVTTSHGVLDALTNGGLGIAFFSPFDNTRYFFPWRPIIVSPLGPEFFGVQGLKVLASEFLFVWVPIMLIGKGTVFWRKRYIRGKRSASVK